MILPIGATIRVSYIRHDRPDAPHGVGEVQGTLYEVSSDYLYISNVLYVSHSAHTGDVIIPREGISEIQILNGNGNGHPARQAMHLH